MSGGDGNSERTPDQDIMVAPQAELMTHLTEEPQAVVDGVGSIQNLTIRSTRTAWSIFTLMEHQTSIHMEEVVMAAIRL